MASSNYGKVIEKKLKLELIANYEPTPNPDMTKSGHTQLKESSVEYTK